MASQQVVLFPLLLFYFLKGKIQRWIFDQKYNLSISGLFQYGIQFPLQLYELCHI